MNSLQQWSAGWPYETLPDGMPIWESPTLGNDALIAAVSSNIVELYQTNLGRQPTAAELQEDVNRFWDTYYPETGDSYDAVAAFAAQRADLETWFATQGGNSQPAKSSSLFGIGLLLAGGYWLAKKFMK